VQISEDYVKFMKEHGGKNQHGREDPSESLKAA
jgi:hypothetical protein